MSDWNEIRGRLVPVLRATTTPAQAWTAAATDPERALVRRRFVPFLHALLAVDHDDHLAFVSAGDLLGWGVDQAEAETFARMNLDPVAGLTLRPDGLWQLAAGDGHEASRLLLPRWLAAFRDRVEGLPLCAAPHARLLLVGGEAQAGLLAELAAQAWETEGNPISPALYTVDEADRVVPYVGGRPREVALAVENAHKRLARREYERQRELLGDLYHTLFARFGLLDDPESGRLLQVTAWTEGSEPLLPLADVVVLHAADGSASWVPFRALLTHAQDHLAVWQDLEPPRFRTLGWPTGAVWEKLMEAAIAREEGAGEGTPPTA